MDHQRRAELNALRVQRDHLNATAEKLSVTLERITGRTNEMAKANRSRSNVKRNGRPSRAAGQLAAKLANLNVVRTSAFGGEQAEEEECIKMALSDPVAMGARLADLTVDLRDAQSEIDRTVEACTKLRDDAAEHFRQRQLAESKRLEQLRKSALFSRRKLTVKKTTLQYQSAPQSVLGERQVICRLVPQTPTRLLSDEIARQCKLGDFAAIRELFGHGATVDDCNTRDEAGTTAVIHCVWHGHVAILAYLLARGVACNISDSGGNTALHFAFEQQNKTPGHRGIIELLLDHGACPTMKNSRKMVPAEMAPQHKPWTPIAARAASPSAAGATSPIARSPSPVAAS